MTVWNDPGGRWLPRSQWLVVAALGASAILMGVAAFAWVLGPEGPSRSGLPEVKLPAASAVAPPVPVPPVSVSTTGAAGAMHSAPQTATVAGGSSDAGPASGGSSGSDSSIASQHTDSAAAAAPAARKPPAEGNTASGGEHSSQREVVQPEVRVEEHPAESNGSGGSSTGEGNEHGDSQSGSRGHGSSEQSRPDGATHDLPEPHAGDAGAFGH
jgi:hypothetical protein